jgi:hypothetical protein
MNAKQRRMKEFKLGSQGKMAAGLWCMARDAVDPDHAAELMAQIPPDTRDLTGFLMGDPLPQRSALAQRTLREVR